jgi:putative transposase
MEIALTGKNAIFGHDKLSILEVMRYTDVMKLIAQVKLQPTPEQAKTLKETIGRSNAAANYVSSVAWEKQVFRQYDLHHLLYHDIRAKFGLSAQMTVRLIAKVADAYKLDKKKQRTFKALGSIAYDDRILSWSVDKRIVSLWTLGGRIKLTFIAGIPQLELLKTRQGEAELIYRNGEFYLHQTCDVDEEPTDEIDGFLGVDLGVANIAVDSLGEIYQGKAIKNVRHRHRKLRSKLQATGTKSSRRLLKKLSGKEHRFATWTNHNVSKRIVAKAKDTGKGIAIEELGGIRNRITVRRSQRATLHSWAFSQLRGFIEYKSKLDGVPVIAVDPRNTSRTCPVCGCVDKANRKSQAVFLCIVCGHSGLADHIAAGNISSRAVVNQPNVSTVDKNSYPQRQGQSHSL